MGLGHLMPLRALSIELLARGHQVFLASRDLSRLREVFGECSVTVLPAPVNYSRQSRSAAITYADLLSGVGFGNAGALATHIDAWRNLFKLVAPDLMVCDHSPTALLASRGLPLPVATVGEGLCLPVDESPLRPFRPVATDQLATARQRERQVLDVMNSALKLLSLPELARATEFYSHASRHFLLTFPELDHYPGRENGDYRGLWPFGWGGRPFERTREGPCVFAYLKPFPALADFLVGLSAMPINSVVYISGTHPVQIEKLQHCRIRFADGPVDLQQAAQRCDLAVTNATHGAGVAMLLSGKPLVHLPMYLEQSLFAAATDRLGASVTVAVKDAKAALRAIEHVLDTPHYAEAARCFAQKHRNDRLQEINQKLVDDLERILAGTG